MLGRHSDLSLDGIDRACHPEVLVHLARGELWELVGRQDRARQAEPAGLVDRVVDRCRATEVGRVTGHRTGCALDAGGGEGSAAVRPEVVLGEVVGEQQAVAERIEIDEARLIRGAVEAVIDAGQRAAEQVVEQPVVRGGLAGMDQLAALVQVVADCDREVLLTFGDGAVGQVEPEQWKLGQLVLRILSEPVVAEIPEHGVVVAEHSEVVWDALSVDVPSVRGDAVGGKCVDVFVDVLRPRVRERGWFRIDTAVVLVGDHQHVVAASPGRPCT